MGQSLLAQPPSYIHRNQILRYEIRNEKICIFDHLIHVLPDGQGIDSLSQRRCRTYKKRIRRVVQWVLACNMWGQLRIILQLLNKIMHIDVPEPRWIFDMEIRMIIDLFFELIY